jgi:hypothetical protein
MRLAAVIALAATLHAGHALAGGNLQVRDPTNPSVVIDTLWDARRLPIHWAMSADGLPGSDIETTTLEAEVLAAFDAWAGVPTSAATLVYDGQVDARDGGAQGPLGARIDGRNLVTFTDPDQIFPAGVLAFTLTSGFLTDVTITADNADLDGDGTPDLPLGTYPAGSIFDADIAFNGAEPWSVGGDDGSVDVRAVALHEVGHFLGLCHSMIRDAVMWPFLASDITAARLLKPDDVAWVSRLYPEEPAFSASFGALSGRVTNGASGLPVLGAHVYAVDPASGARGVGGYTADDGSFVLPGIAPGGWQVAIEPLDGDPPGLEPARVNLVVAGTQDTAFPEERFDDDEGAVEADPTAATTLQVNAGAETPGVDFVTNTLTLPGANRQLDAGMSFFSWPVAVPSATTAFDVLAALGGPDEVAAVDRYVPRTGRFERAHHVDGAASGVDFPVRGGEGYVLYMRRAQLAGFAGGSDCPAVDLAAGLNLIGVPCRPPGYGAFALLADLGGHLVVERVVALDDGVYRDAGFDLDGEPSGDDFPIEPGAGYAVVMRVARGGVRLPSPSREVTPHIAGLSPGRGVPGTVVAILGEGFDPVATNNIVTFGGVVAPVVAATTTTVTATVPGPATSGPVRVTVDGRPSNTVDFVVVPAVVQPSGDAPTELVSGQVAEAGLGADGDQDRYTFTALAGSVVTITATAQSPGMPDLVLVLEDPYGVVVATDDNGGGNTDARINNHVVQTTGVQTVVVTNVPGSGAGPYRLSITIATRPAPTQVSILGGNYQSAEGGAPLDLPLTVLATGPTGAPLAGIPVTFLATAVEVQGLATPLATPGPAEAGTIVLATSASGIVSVDSVLPVTPGTYDVQVGVPGATPVHFTLAATTTAVHSVTIAGGGQTGTVDAILPEPLQVVLKNALGHTVPGGLVAFEVVAGGGRLLPAGAQSTGDDGAARTLLTLGKNAAAPQIVAAFVPGRAAPILFEAFARADVPAKLTSNKSTFTRLTVGTTVLNALWVRVLDRFDNPVPGVTVSYVPPAGTTVEPGIGPSGVPFPDFKTDASGLNVAAVSVPFVTGPTGTGAPGHAPTIDELGARRGQPVVMSANVAGNVGTEQVFHLDIDCGPRLTGQPPASTEALIGEPLGAPLSMHLVRYERTDRNGNNDFRDENFNVMQPVAVAGATVRLATHRADGRDERQVRLQPTRTATPTVATDVAGVATTTVTMGDVGGAQQVVGRIPSVTVTFSRAGNQQKTFTNPETLTQASTVFAIPVSILVHLSDSGSGLDLTSVRSTLDALPFFDGTMPPAVLPVFPDKLQVRAGGQLLGTLGPDLVRQSAFAEATLIWQPHAQRLRRSPMQNNVDVFALRDRAGNVDPAQLSEPLSIP